MKLIRLTLDNFKGIKHFTLEPRGENLRVLGDNASGKTSLFDAFLWLLFGKDSTGKANFSIKTLDRLGNVVHGLEHSAEAVIEIDGTPVCLKKSFYEKWAKKPRSTIKVFSGHSTKYFIDDVPVSKAEYERKINELFVGEPEFRLLTSPAYFADLHWQERRRILMHEFGDVDDSQVIKSDPALSGLPNILGNKTTEEVHKWIKANQTKINQELKEIPVRIDELSRSIPENTDVMGLRDELWKVEKELGRQNAGSSYADWQQKVFDAENEVKKWERMHQKAVDANRDARDKEIRELKRAKAEIQDKQYEFEHQIKSHEQKIETLRKQFVSVAGQTYDENQDICPACGQSLPPGQIQEAIENFNKDKADKLESINEIGRGLTKKVADLVELSKEQQANWDQINQKILSLQAFQNENLEIPQYKERWDKAIKELDELKKQEPNGPDESVIQKLKEQRDQLLADIAAANAAVTSKERIERLQAQEKKLSAEYELLERQKSLIENFIVAKVKMVEEKINSEFTLANFKMFSVQVNGEIVETCEITHEGVPYSTGLNKGAQINVGLDIIKTLSNRYGNRAPVFVDNAEAVTKLFDPGTQVIELIVDGNHKTLHVEG